MRTLIISIAVAATLASGLVHAEDGVLRVRLSDLDLGQASDVAVARHRIELAIRDYCANPTAYPMGGYMERCKHDLENRAVIRLAGLQAASHARVALR